MSGWLRKLFGKESNHDSPNIGIALSEQQKSALRAELGRLNEKQWGVGDRVIRYVLTGEDTEVLDLLGGSKELGAALSLKVCKGWTDFKLPHLFTPPVQDPTFYVRLGKVYEAASRSDGRTLHLDDAGVPAWLEILLWEASNIAPTICVRREVWLSHDVLEAALAIAGERVDSTLRALLFTLRNRPSTRCTLLKSIPGLPQAVQRHPGVVHEMLTHPSARLRVQAIEILTEAQCSPVEFAATLVSIDSPKTVRDAAETWLMTAGEQLLPALRAMAESGTPRQRARAVNVLWRIGGGAERRFLEQRRANETAVEVTTILDGLLLQPAAAKSDGAAQEIRAITAGPLPPLPPRVRDTLWELVDGWQAEEHDRTSRTSSLSRADVDQWFRFLQTPTTSIEDVSTSPPAALAFYWIDAVKPLLASPELTLGHVVRLAAVLGLLRKDQRSGSLESASGLLDLAKAFQRARGVAFGLCEIAAEAKAIGVAPDAIGRALLFMYSRPQGWSDEEVWPYFFEQSVLLEMALGLRPIPSEVRSRHAKEIRQNALAIIGLMPQPPDSLQAVLWEIALGTGKLERPFAQRCLDNVPGADLRITAALADKSQDVREAAADWLAGRGDRSAVEPLMVAVKKEKKDRVKAAMMKALEVLGSSVDEFLDRPGLLKEAKKGLAKGVPAALDWFAFDRLPAVHWADDRQAVDRSILTWWIVHAHKLATPEPSPLLRRYATRLVADDAGALGRLVLEAWIAHDTVTPTEQQAQAKAAQMVQQLGSVQPNVLAQGTQQILKTPVGSAIEHKGVLAIAGAMAGDTAAPLVARYLKDWYGMRAAQCKALLQMLAWVDHRSASQLLLQTAARFPTPGIRKLAEECVREVAQRRGWSVEELADRTIPTAEIDDDGVLRLSYGPRCFEARLDDELKLTITTPDGKTVSNLPEPRAVDDESAAKEAKQRFSQARKQLKTVLQQQRERLYDAMCTQRRWRFDDWQTYLAQHPIVGRLCQRVVWTASPNDDPTASMRAFRPLGDGTMSGPDDSTIAIAADASVGVAHPLLLPDDEVAAWTKHLADYQVGTLFDQFGRPPYRVPEQKSGETALSDFRGHVVEAFKLRGHATKLGYVRGQAGDGGWFYAYRRHFPSIGLTAELRFSGNSLPEENRKVTLEAMHFESEEDGANLGSEVPLSRVPAVLVSECWNDLREIATEGPGFDPDWKRTVAQ